MAAQASTGSMAVRSAAVSQARLCVILFFSSAFAWKRFQTDC
jgi:hypothetical protein